MRVMVNGAKIMVIEAMQDFLIQKIFLSMLKIIFISLSTIVFERSMLKEQLVHLLVLGGEIMMEV